MRPGGNSRAALIALGVVVVAALAVVGQTLLADSENHHRVSTRYIERRLATASQDDAVPLSEIQCARKDDTDDSFECFVEGENSLHYRLDVGLTHDRELIVRDPNAP